MVRRLLVALFASLVAEANALAQTDAPPRAPADEAPPDPDADLVERLMTSDPEEEDLDWLFSHQDEYTPSDLTGKPIDVPALPERGEGSPRAWDPRWRKFGTGNWFVTGAAFTTAAASNLIPPRREAWRRRNAFDERGRRVFGIDDYEAGRWARDLSDVLVSVNATFPLLIDSLIVTYWYRRSEEVAGQMALISLEALAVTSAIQGLTSSLTSRERPFGRDCGTTIDPNLNDCESSSRYRSFFSGHSSTAFAAASVTCSLHAQHDVFGDPLADGLTCAAALGSAGTVALMRVVGQRHYLSDVMTGSAVGALFGFGVPWLLHYRIGGAPPAGAQALSWRFVPMTNGIAIGGEF